MGASSYFRAMKDFLASEGCDLRDAARIRVTPYLASRAGRARGETPPAALTGGPAESTWAPARPLSVPPTSSTRMRGRFPVRPLKVRSVLGGRWRGRRPAGRPTCSRRAGQLPGFVVGIEENAQLGAGIEGESQGQS